MKKRELWLFAILACASARGRAQVLDDSCVIFGPFARQVRANRDGSFVIGLPLVNPTRLTVLCERDGIRLYGESEFFDVVPNQTVPAGVIRFSPTPFPTLERIAAQAPSNITVGQQVQVSVTGFFSDGTSKNDSQLFYERRNGNQYTSSNLAILTVGADGQVTAVGHGSALVTVANQGTVTTTAINVVDADIETLTLEGFVQLDTGAPVGGAFVTLPDASPFAEVTTIPSGYFAFQSILAEPDHQRLVVHAAIDANTAYFYYDPAVPLLPGLKTDAGILTLHNDIFWNVTTGSLLWDDGLNWSGRIPPRRNNDATIDLPGDLLIRKTAASTSAMTTLVCKERLTLENGTFSVVEPFSIDNTFTIKGSGTSTVLNSTVNPGSGGQGIDVNGYNSSNGPCAVFDHATLNASLNVLASSAAGFQNGLVLNGTMNLALTVGEVFTEARFVGTQTLSGTGSILFGVDGGNGYNKLVRLRPFGVGSKLTIASGMTIRGGSGLITGDGSFENQGLIVAESSGINPLQIYCPDWVNHALGTIEAKNGAHLHLGLTNWRNRGTITASGGSKLFLRGSGWANENVLTVSNATLALYDTFTMAQLGTYSVSGATSEIRIGYYTPGTGSGGTLMGNVDLGSQNTNWGLMSGAIVGGTISGSGKTLNIINTNLNSTFPAILDQVVCDANLQVQGESWVKVRNGLTLNGTATLDPVFNGNNGTRFEFEGMQTLQGIGQIIIPGGPNNTLTAARFIPITGELTIGPNITIRGGRADIGGNLSFVNQGTIIAETGSNPTNGSNAISMVSAVWRNEGTIEAKTNGSVVAVTDYHQTAGTTRVLSPSSMSAAGKFDIDGGLVTGNGTLTGNVESAGVIAPGNAGAGRLTMTGTYTQQSGGSLAIEIGGTTQESQYDHLQVNGAVTLAGTLTVALINGFTPTTGDSFTILNGSTVSGTFASPPAGFTVQYNATSVVLVAQ